MTTYAETIALITAQLGVPVTVSNEWEAAQALCFELAPVVLSKRGGGVKITQVRQLELKSRDVALALGVQDVRFVQNGRLILEVPKANPDMVLPESLDSIAPGWRARNLLPVRLGQMMNGGTLTLDLAGAPHLLVAGTTGSGKSVCLRNLVMELCAHNPAVMDGWEDRLRNQEAPRAVRLHLIDPKRVELAQFRNYPHVASTVTDYTQARELLELAKAVVDRRYRQMEAVGVNNIEQTRNLHRVVIVIEEFADLILRDAEAAKPIVHIAQMGRAAGVHLVMATQRPSADVVAGLIKANFPTRIAFRVASGLDSRIVLDETGAEKLGGHGDGLLMTAEGLVRFQGVYID